MRGGKRPNAGRKPGSKNRLDQRLATATAQLDKLLGKGPTPLEFLLDVMRTDPDRELCVEAAKAAAPYIHRKQPQAVEVGEPGEFNGVELIVPGLKGA